MTDREAKVPRGIAEPSDAAAGSHQGAGVVPLAWGADSGEGCSVYTLARGDAALVRQQQEEQHRVNARLNPR